MPCYIAHAVSHAYFQSTRLRICKVVILTFIDNIMNNGLKRRNIKLIPIVNLCIYPYNEITGYTKLYFSSTSEV